MRNLGLALILVVGVSCNAFAKDVRDSLAAGDSGDIRFKTAGSLKKPAVKGGLFSLSSESVEIEGDLRLPPGDGPFPAVILAHGCGGKGYAEPTWVPVLNRWGYATFVVDSYGPRRIAENCIDAWKLIPVEHVPDVYGALRLLATHPKIDKNAIALMGFSMGGMVTVNSATVWAKNNFAPEGSPRFRAFFPFYPYCNASYPEREEISAPLRLHTGDADDWTPAKPCVEWTDRLKANGFNASITLYAGAPHSFDTAFGSVVRFAEATNASTCTPVYPGILGPYDLAKNFPSSCMKRGATVGQSPKAIEEAKVVLRAQLEELVRGPESVR